MKRNPGPGKLIVLEGLDGAGTTTQCARLADWLRRRYRKEEVPRVYITREPSQGPAGAQLRSILTRRIRVDRYTLAALFTADRIDHLYEQSRGVVARLNAGEWVIMDRYYLSSFAYQAMSLDIDQGELRWLWHLHEPCVIPDVTFFLDVPVGTCMQRIALDRGFHFELFEKQESLEAVRKKYLDAIGRFVSVDQNVQMVEGTARINTVTRYIRERVDKMFFEPSALPFDAQQAVWQKWPLLKAVRRAAEEELALSFVTIKKIPASSDPGGQGGSRGGYQMELASGEYLYHVAGYFSGGGRYMKLQALGKADETRAGLEKLVKQAGSQQQSTLWSGGEG